MNITRLSLSCRFVKRDSFWALMQFFLRPLLPGQATTSCVRASFSTPPSLFTTTTSATRRPSNRHRSQFVRKKPVPIFPLSLKKAAGASCPGVLPGAGQAGQMYEIVIPSSGRGKVTGSRGREATERER